MDYSVDLPDAAIEALSDPDRAFADASLSYEGDTHITGGANNSAIFDQSLRLWNTLNTYENKAKTEPSWRVLAVLTGCEFALWRLNAKTPLKHNPFLIHWVEAIQRLGKQGTQNNTGTTNGTGVGKGITSDEIATVRAEWIRRLLLTTDTDASISSTPRQIYHEVVKLGKRKPFNIEPYQRMLVEQGIWDGMPDASHAVTAKKETSSVAASKRKLDQPRPDASKHWKTKLLDSLTEQPDDAIQELTRLPLELPYLDFLTTLLADRMLEQHAIDPAPVITSYIQHALRLIETMEAPPPNAGQDSNGVDTVAWSASDTNGILEYGKEAQGRYVRLLLLFIKSLMRKNLLGAEVLYFEIQEICVRYVWLKEVRDFRAWVEEGDSREEVG